MGESGGAFGMFAIANARDALKGDYLRQAGDATTQQPVTEIDQMTSHVNALRERLGALERSSQVFGSMGDAIKAGAVDRDSMVRDFEAGAHLLLNLENGTVRYGDAVQRFYQMLDKGDTAGISKFAGEHHPLPVGHVCWEKRRDSGRHDLRLGSHGGWQSPQVMPGSKSCSICGSVPPVPDQQANGGGFATSGNRMRLSSRISPNQAPRTPADKRGGRALHRLPP